MMLYFHNTSQEIQKLATYAAKSFQLLGGFAPRPPDQGLCPWTPLGAQPPDPSISPMPAIPPKMGCLDKTLGSDIHVVLETKVLVSRRLEDKK